MVIVHMSFRFCRLLADIGISMDKLKEEIPALISPKRGERRPE